MDTANPNVYIEGNCDPAFGPVREAFAENFRQGDLGAGCAVCLEGQLVVDLWGGHRDLARRHRWQADSLVNFWSSSKMLAALCVLLLHDRGALCVDAPLADYWPEFAANGKGGVLVRHVLGHTAGLPVFDQPLDELAVFDHELGLQRLAAQPLRWQPGQGSGYHAETQGWLLGELVQRVAGCSMGEFLASEIAGPLGLDLHLGLQPAQFMRVAEMATAQATLNQTPDLELRALGQAASLRSLSLVNTPSWRRAQFPASNIHGTAVGLAQALAILANGGRAGGRQWLGLDTIERALDVQAEGIDRITGRHFKLGMGFGLHCEQTPLGNNDRTLWWAGWGGSFGVVDLENRLSVAYVMNRMAGDEDLRGPAIIFAAHRSAASLRAG